MMTQQHVLPQAATHLCAQLQHEELVTLTDSVSVQACLAEAAKEGVEQRKGQRPHRRAPTVESGAVLMQLCLAIDMSAIP